MILKSVLCLLTLVSAVASAQNTTPAVTATDLDTLKQKIAAQQEQIKKLQQAIDDQQKLLEQSLQNIAAKSASATKTSDGTPVAETSTSSNTAGPVRFVPAIGGRANQKTNPVSSGTDGANPCEGENVSPTFLRIGNACIIPVGFMDLTAVWRDKNAGSSIGTNFGSIPYNTSANAKNSEFRFSPQNSRIGFRVDANFKGVHVIGYNEMDFLGTSGATNLTVTNGAFVPRLRLFWVDLRKGKVEFLAGQSWSMLTPNRTGISALPGDLFYSQAIDVNYMAGLTWTRQAGIRVLYHPNNKVTFGLSFENPDQYMGGANGSGAITLPAALAGLAVTQLDNGGTIGTANTVLTTPTVSPDIIAKIAFDPSSRFHFEVAGVTSQYKIWNPNVAPALGAGQHFSTTGAGIQVGINAAVTKNFRLISTNFWDDGEGRFLFGQAPDLIVRANGALSGVRSGGTVDGFEAVVKNTLIYAYYGGVYIGRNTALDANGKTLIGYGFAGSANSQNRSLQEGTFGFNQTMWKNPRYGAVNMMGQYQYSTRNPWAVLAGAPSAAHDNTIYFNLRYSLPGSMPKF